MSTAARSFVVRHVWEDSAERVVAFYQKHISPFIWPRTLDEINSLARNEHLFEVVEVSASQAVTVGVCYVKEGEPENGGGCWEFGGLYVAESCRGLGIASALGISVISSHFALMLPAKLIAHVHVENSMPRGLLQEQLGFRLTGQVQLPGDDAPKNMKRDENGFVVGDVFEFGRSRLGDFANWIESFSGELIGKSGEKVFLRFDVPSLRDYRDETVTALRSLG